MSVFITADGMLHRDHARPMVCPHCGMAASQAVAATPDFQLLRTRRPERVGVVLACEHCAMPIFLRYRVRAVGDSRIDLNPVPEEVERPRETFSVHHLPPRVATHFSEALGCYSHGLWRAFAAMCRLTARAMAADLGDSGRLRMFDLAREVQDLAEIDDESFLVIRRVLFDDDSDHSIPTIDRRQAALLLETTKDLLQQIYLRRARLRQALRMRRWFADEQPTPGRPTPRAAHGTD